MARGAGSRSLSHRRDQPQHTSSNHFVLAGHWMRDNRWFRPAPMAVGAVLFTLGGVLSSVEPTWEDWSRLYIWLFVAGLVLTVLGFVLDRSHEANRRDIEAKISDIEAENGQLRADAEALAQVVADALEITQEIIRAAAVEHGLGSEERVTVYRRDADELVAVHRWSGDNKYRAMSEQTLVLLDVLAARDPSPGSQCQHPESHHRAQDAEYPVLPCEGVDAATQGDNEEHERERERGFIPFGHQKHPEMVRAPEYPEKA